LLGSRYLPFLVGLDFEFFDKPLCSQKPLVDHVLIFLPVPLLQALLDKSPVCCAPSQHVENPAGLQHLTCSSAAVVAMAAVRIIIQLVYEFGPDRIQMNVAYKSQ